MNLIKLITALQRGQELANSDRWKNRSGKLSMLVIVLAVAAAFSPVPVSDEAVAAIGTGLVAAIEVVQLYLNYATSKRVGLPPPADE